MKLSLLEIQSIKVKSLYLLTVLLIENLERFDKLVGHAFNDAHLCLGFFFEVSQVKWHVLILSLYLRFEKKCVDFSWCLLSFGMKHVESFI